jgi:hypothetical protein
MCHDLDFDLLRQAYLEELNRRVRDRRELVREPKGEPAPAPSAVPRARDKEPVPA